MLRYARQIGCSFTETVICEKAAKGGHLDVLMYSHATGLMWNPSCCVAAAASSGHLEVTNNYLPLYNS